MELQIKNLRVSWSVRDQSTTSFLFWVGKSRFSLSAQHIYIKVIPIRLPNTPLSSLLCANSIFTPKRVKLPTMKEEV